MPKPRAPADEPIVFGPFTLDPVGGQLLRHATVVPLRRKALEVLRYLATRNGEVVPNEELLDAVWPNLHVTPQTLTNVIRELRIALDERAREPRFLHTMHRQGHCLMTSPPTLDGGARVASTIVVGRDDEIRRLEALWRDALTGRSRIAFVTGEPGIGKTTLVDAAVRAFADHTPGMRIGRGTCVEQHGRDEAYIPILTALDDLVTGPQGDDALATLRRSAPTWLVQLPWRLTTGDHERLERALMGTTAGRMLREGLALLRLLAGERPLLLVLEDLHWSDLATLDLLAALGRRPLTVPLLVLATYRRVDAVVRDHTVVELARDLRRTGAVDELALSPFDARAVGAYLAARFAPATFPPAFCTRLLEHSAGNPLFLSALVDQLLARGAIAAGEGGWRLVGDPETILLELPQSLRDFVMAELAAMDPETREVVEAASVAGPDLGAAEVAAALDRPPDAVERTCEAVARIGRVLRIGDEPDAADGREARRYVFVHAAHRRIVYDQIAPLRRRALHAATAHGLLASAGSDAIAARLALHFERAGEPAKASEQFERAARHAERRYAYRESAAYIRAALGHVGDDVPERAAGLQLRLGALLALVGGFSASATEEAFHRARTLWTAANRPDGLFMAEMALCRLHLARAEIGTARVHSDRLLALRDSALPGFSVHACCWAGITASSLGELRRARTLLEEGRAAPPAPGLIIHHDVHRILRSQLALVLTAVGDLPGAAAVGAEALDGSVSANRAADLGHALVQAAECAAFRRDDRAGAALAARAITVAEESELPSFLALGRFYQAAMDGGRPARERLAVMRGALDARHALGDRWQDSVLLTLVAERQLADGDLAGAASTLDEAEAHVARSDERHSESELLRLRGELALARGGKDGVAEARTLLQRALTIGAKRGALLFELRTACVLARLPLPSAARAEARRTLQRIARRFPAKVTCPDLETARALLGAA